MFANSAWARRWLFAQRISSAPAGSSAFASYLADDYQLAKRITNLGTRATLSGYVVETSLGDATWAGIWRHQLRWARTIRLSKGAGHAGLPITHAGLWAAIAAVSGRVAPAAVLLALRITSAFLSGAFVLRSTLAADFCVLSPLWDLYSFAVWLASYAGRKVRWRDRVLTIGADGLIVANLLVCLLTGVCTSVMYFQFEAFCSYLLWWSSCVRQAPPAKVAIINALKP